MSRDLKVLLLLNSILSIATNIRPKSTRKFANMVVLDDVKKMKVQVSPDTVD